MPAAVWANAGPPHVPGRLIGEPNGLESVAIKHERLTFDLRPLAGAASAQVEALYEIENTGEECTVDLVFVSGPMVSDSAAVVLDDQPIVGRWLGGITHAQLMGSRFEGDRKVRYLQSRTCFVGQRSLATDRRSCIGSNFQASAKN